MDGQLLRKVQIPRFDRQQQLCCPLIANRKESATKSRILSRPTKSCPAKAGPIMTEGSFINAGDMGLSLPTLRGRVVLLEAKHDKNDVRAIFFFNAVGKCPIISGGCHKFELSYWFPLTSEAGGGCQFLAIDRLAFGPQVSGLLPTGLWEKGRPKFPRLGGPFLPA